MRACVLALTIALAGTLAGASASRAETAPVCPHQPALLAAAELVLAEPDAPGKFYRDNFGADAAYLVMRYGRLDAAARAALLERLAAREKQPRRLDELILAHASTTERQALIAAMQAELKEESVLQQVQASGLRALIVEDGGEWLVGEFRAWRERTPDPGRFLSPAADLAARSIADTDDAIKAAFASKAEAAGVWPLAYMANVYRDDLSPLLALLDRAPADAFQAARADLIDRAITLAQLQPGFDIARQPQEIQAADAAKPGRRDFRPLAPLVAAFPDAALLNVVLNQTGERRVATELAVALNSGIADGRYDPAARPDQLFVAMIDGLERILGPKLASVLGGFDLVGKGKAVDYVDRVIGRFALAPLVRDGGEPPARPRLFGSQFDWEEAVQIARTLAANQAVTDADVPVAAELLAAAGRMQEAVALLAATSDKARRAPAVALMIALDLACDNALQPPLPFYDSIYRFAPRS